MATVPGRRAQSLSARPQNCFGELWTPAPDPHHQPDVAWGQLVATDGARVHRMEVETVSCSGPGRSGQGMEGDITHHPPLAASGRAHGAAEGWQTYSEVPNLLHMGCPMCLGVGAGGALPSTAHLQLLVCAGGSRAPEQRSARVGVAQLPRLPKAGVTQGDGGSGRDELWVQSRSSQHQTFMVPLLFQLACGGKSPRRGFPPLGYLGPQGGRAHNGAGRPLLPA